MTRSTTGAAATAMLALLSCPFAFTLAAEQAPTERVPEALAPIAVQGQRVAILEPANTYASLATALRYDPAVRLQTRGLPEGQADVTVRGGLFENTGFRIGAVTLIDPQTGHYAVEVPFDPAMLGSPEVLTDASNALLGFNASVATLQYRIRPLESGGEFTVGAGSDALRFGVLRAAQVRDHDSGSKIGIGVSLAGSRGDGTVPFGDHEFERYAARISRVDGDAETHLLAGYHDKFFGWPGAYTGFASLPETDHTRLSLLLADHRRVNAHGWWEVTAAWRRLRDDYDFDRRTVESGVPGAFEHETRAAMIGLTAEQRRAGLDWIINVQFTADRLVHSTDLIGGAFNSRSYLSASLAPTWRWAAGNGTAIRLMPGLRADWSNRDEDRIAPVLGLELERLSGRAVSRIGLELTRSTQLPGYTALKSPPQGLFGGNPDLGREYADTATLSLAHERDAWRFEAALFHRRDRDLVDWTFRRGAPFVRQANPVDIDVFGLETAWEWRLDTVWLLGSYAWLDKDADYGSAAVDASYYALNYARHRATLALAWQPVAALELRIDTEYRRHQANPLRTGSHRSVHGAASAAWRPGFAPAAQVVLAADNLTDEAFQEFPGAPALGRQWSVSLRYGF